MLVYIFVLVIMSVLTFIIEHTSDNVCPDLHDSSKLAIISVLTFITVVNILYLSFTDCLLQVTLLFLLILHSISNYICVAI